MEQPRHSIEDLYNRQESDRRLMLETRETVAAMGSKLDALISTVSSIAHSMNKPPQPTNWIGIAMLILATLAATGGYIQTRFSPVERLLEIHDTGQRAQAFQNGVTTAELAGLRRDVDRLR